MIAGMFFVLDGIMLNYILPVKKLIDEAELINTANPSHRIDLKGNWIVVGLGRLINEAADRFENLKGNVDQEIRLAKAEIEAEKNMLAAFMAELPDGVLICNSKGRILLYNKQAKGLFTHPQQGGHRRDGQKRLQGSNRPGLTSAGASRHTGDNFLGIGRSVFSIIDKNLIIHALDEMAGKSYTSRKSPAPSFVVVTKGNKMLRVEALPVLTKLRKLTGFVLIFNDITDKLERARRVGLLQESLTKQLRASLAGIQSAVETIIAYPEMKAEQQKQFHNIIHHESTRLGRVVDEAALDGSEQKTRWPLVPLRVWDVIVAIVQEAQTKLGISVNMEMSDEDHQIRVDTYAFKLVVFFVLVRLRDISGCERYTCACRKEGRYVNLDLYWDGDPIKIEVLRKWHDQVLAVEKEQIPFTLREVIGHHEAGIGSSSFSDTENDRPFIRIFLPFVQAVKPDRLKNITILTEESRPVFYDFDLFHQAGQTPEWDHRRLTELEYTVFDTETTGLDPKTDAIISISAVRIVNCRLLNEEVFEQFIDPRRSIPPESIRIHGIQPEMLKGKPTIEQVLPSFQSFTENTILVAHNAAFDMRMLAINEDTTGISFTNPVLDTLLLSDVLHVAHQNHDLEAIARRMGVTIVGRHTSMGDAIATCEIFLKMIPLLAKQGIHTLEDARLASRKSSFSKLKF